MAPPEIGDDLERLYGKLRLVRRTEEELARLYPSDAIKSPMHLSIGQESVAVGVCDALEPGDYASGTYRGHATYLAKGGDLDAMVAELFGKATGVARGKGGSMHLIDMANGVLGTSAVVGTTVPVALGFALALKRRRSDRVVAAFFGDGATDEGVIYESLNFAALHRLPVLFVCENNGLAIHTPVARRWATDRLCERVATYGIPTERFAEPDTLALRAAAARRVAALRRGEGPAFFECLTYRWREHVGPGEDYEAGYRARAELRRWQDGDEVARLGALLSAERRAAIDAEVERRIAAAVRFAETSPWPADAELDEHVHA